MTGAEFHGVDIDLLADYAGGALDGTPEAERVAALIAAEPAWREAFELLEPGMAAVGALLGELPVEPMPVDVVARIDAALAGAGVVPQVGLTRAAGTTPDGDRAAGTTPAGEQAGATPGGDGAHAVPPIGGLDRGGSDAVPQTVIDLDQRRRKRGNHRWVRVAAPIGIAAGVAGFFGYGLLGQNEGASDTAGSRAAAGEATAPAAPRQTLNSGTDYTLGTLAQSLRRATGEPMAPPEGASTMAGPAGAAALDRLRDQQALLDCLAAIARENGGGPLTADTVDYARFGGEPALVVRFTAANGGWSWASGPDCGLPGGDADTLGSVPVR
ncbi:cupin domain-containing protein [Actinoplanes siamensis]|uniref:Uncharacterized protein n=1 Tax=Actinoplanes siamensis TaxID=1223317 RepID=A0A919TNK8_9ACTN|nr:hypothetical protein [Actinoplanes siamensis]GIF08842.1 hypothetical protein Asi03nite_63800 [Actinoplanes siamensis]